jgi:putative peptidoglycan lipid II flippase
MRLRLGISWRNPVLKEYMLIALPLMLGQSIVVLDETFMRVFGQFISQGAATELNYARRTMLVPVGVIAQAAGVAAYPFLARLFAEGRIREMKDTVDRALRYVLIFSVIAAALVGSMSIPIVRALFQRGNFTADGTVGTAEALFFYVFAIPVWGALQILNRAFYARKEMWTPVVVGTAATIVAIPLYAFLQNTFGIRGVALASTLALAVYASVLAGVWYAATDSVRLRLLLAQTGRVIPLAVVGGFAAYAVNLGIERIIDIAALGSFATTIISVATVVLGSAAFVGVAVLLGGLLYDLLSRRPAAQTSDA